MKKKSWSRRTLAAQAPIDDLHPHQSGDFITPASERDAPLLYDRAGRLLFVAELGIDARAVAEPGEPQLALGWEPDS